MAKPDKLRSRTPTASRPHMPGYGLPKGKAGLLSWRWAEQRLKRSHNYWITTVRPDCSPHAMIVWGLWLDGRFYFSTGNQSRKARNLAKNPKCIVCTEDAGAAVIVEGEARLVAGPRLPGFFARYEKKYHWDMSAYQDEPVFEVRPRVAFGLAEKKSLNAATRWRFRKDSPLHAPDRAPAAVEAAQPLRHTAQTGSRTASMERGGPTHGCGD